MIDTHYETLGDERVESVRLCHGDDDRGFSPCTYGNVDSVSWLSNLQGKMEENPRDVVTLLVENYVQPDHLLAVFEQANLYEKVYIHTLNTPWPTLLEMIDQGTNLVVFWEQSGDASHPWVHDFLTHSWTTNFAEENTEDMTCDLLRGDVEQEVYHMNNWLRGPLGLSDPTRGDEANDSAHFFLLTADKGASHEVSGWAQLSSSIIENRTLCLVRDGIAIVPPGVDSSIFWDKLLDLLKGLINDWWN